MTAASRTWIMMGMAFSPRLKQRFGWLVGVKAAVPGGIRNTLLPENHLQTACQKTPLLGEFQPRCTMTPSP